MTAPKEACKIGKHARSDSGTAWSRHLAYLERQREGGMGEGLFRRLDKINTAIKANLRS